ncbi:hypothetical protein NP493_1025g01061 [Ridgeia piscesae]|uniref:P4-ATPase flippase complex beta subunit TMEM30A n=1 Tax=Ridgeia piscesae TaxID=27915 RepID=A0AAD9NKN5_RIDPI|nr:hypothetical protein NP493_1025g01061 [Ridgeia piscesae]
MMSSSESEDKGPSRRPKDTKFKQQKLPAWQPIMTAGTVLPVFFAIGIAFVPLGVALLITADNVQEKIIPYTHCKPVAGTAASSHDTCAEYISNNTGATCQCHINFSLKEDFRGDVYMYYGLTNFYQNHRRYVKSRNDNQLRGVKQSKSTDDCDPFYMTENDTTRYYYAPCGAIANSMFNDTLKLNFVSHATLVSVGLLKKDIAWTTDRTIKFKNPEGKTLKEAFKGTIKPVNWQKAVYELDPDDDSNNGYQNEDLIVWMRTAALPNFRKLYRRVNHTEQFVEGLPKGNYTLLVDYNYPVVGFDGEKKMIPDDDILAGREEPVPWHRVLGRRQPLHTPGHHLPHRPHPSRQEVSLSSRFFTAT